MSTPQSVVRDRSVSVTQVDDHYTVTDRFPDEALVLIEVNGSATPGEATHMSNVQLPNGLPYRSGQVAELTIAQVDEIDASLFTDGLTGGGALLTNNGFAPGLQAEGSAIALAVAGAGGATLGNSATKQYTATLTYANGDTEALTLLADGVVWTSSTPAVADIDDDGLATSFLVDGTTEITATFRGLTGSATLTVA